MPPINLFTDRELATLLAALRLWQTAHEHSEDLAAYAGHFAEVSSLSSLEINDLCERLNHN
jgi:hypothetical protein